MIRLSADLGRFDPSYMIGKALSLLLNPAGAYYTMLEIRESHPGLLTGIVFVALISVLEALGQLLGIFLAIHTLLGPLPGMAGVFLARALLTSLVVGPIVGVIGWLILTLISYVIGKIVRGEPVEVPMGEFSSLAVMFAFAAAPGILMIIPWMAAGPALAWLVNLAVGAWSYYYTWTAARAMFEVDEMKAVIITAIQLLMFLWSLISTPWAFTAGVALP